MMLHGDFSNKNDIVLFYQFSIYFILAICSCTMLSSLLTNIKNACNSARKPFPLNTPAAVKSCSPNQISLAFCCWNEGFFSALDV
jgi:hypothetical protein